MSSFDILTVLSLSSLLFGAHSTYGDKRDITLCEDCPPLSCENPVRMVGCCGVCEAGK